jgi:single-stranded DNA-binding protein
MNYVKKGDKVYIEGKISHYTTEGESSKTIVSVNVETIELLSDKKKTEDI